MYADKRPLLPKQSKELIEKVSSLGLEPSEFSCELRPSKTFGAVMVSVFFHEPSGWYFYFESAQNFEWWYLYAPGETTYEEKGEAKTWSVEEDRFCQWLGNIIEQNAIKHDWPNTPKELAQIQEKSASVTELPKSIEQGLGSYGKWIVEDILSSGGQGKTFRVHDLDDPKKKRFVLKTRINNEHSNRFPNEVRACSELNHPNVLKIVDFYLDSDEPYIVSEWCKGGALSAWNISNMSIVDRLEMFLAICKGVGHAHLNPLPIIHRDIKPDNIFLRKNGTPVVGDFGICFIEGEDRMTRLTEIVGPRLFMAPELEGPGAHEITAASDVYSLGKLLYWILSGKRIFSREVHREEPWDLRLTDKSPTMYLVYELLDQMIVYAPDRRIMNAAKVSIRVEELIRMAKTNAHLINLETPQACNYCGIGQYITKVSTFGLSNQPSVYGPTPIYELLRSSGFGFENIDKTEWLILACDHCGNIQVFRPDWTENPKTWIAKK